MPIITIIAEMLAEKLNLQWIAKKHFLKPELGKYNKNSYFCFMNIVTLKVIVLMTDIWDYSLYN